MRVLNGKIDLQAISELAEPFTTRSQAFAAEHITHVLPVHDVVSANHGDFFSDLGKKCDKFARMGMMAS